MARFHLWTSARSAAARLQDSVGAASCGSKWVGTGGGKTSPCSRGHRARTAAPMWSGEVETHGRPGPRDIQGRETAAARRLRGVELASSTSTAGAPAPRRRAGDEIANQTNAPGSRNAKRWQEVDECSTPDDVVSTVKSSTWSRSTRDRAITGVKQRDRPRRGGPRPEVSWSTSPRRPCAAGGPRQRYGTESRSGDAKNSSRATSPLCGRGAAVAGRPVEVALAR